MFKLKKPDLYSKIKEEKKLPEDQYAGCI